jgi:hypothetical protein
MGGRGSSRWGPRVPCACTHQVAGISVRALLRECPLRFPVGFGRKNTAPARLWFGDELGLLSVSVDTRGWPAIDVALADVRDLWHFDLVPIRPPFGGHRFWFLCPVCGRRIGALYYRRREWSDYARDWRGGRSFDWGCRRCHRLLCPAQVATKRQRADHRWAQVLRRLKAPIGAPTERPARPCGMHRTTYARLLEQLSSAALRRALTAGKGLPWVDDKYPWPEHFPKPQAKPRGRAARLAGLLGPSYMSAAT